MITAATKAQIARLRELSRDAKARQSTGYIIIEGEILIREAQSSGWEAVALYAREDQMDRAETLAAEWGVPCFSLSPADCERAADTKSPQGMLAIVARPPMDMWESMPKVVLAMEHVQDPGNVGALLRVAEAAGVQAVLQGNDCCDPYSPKAIRSARGSAFRLSLRRCTDLLGAMASLCDRGGHTVIGSSLTGRNLYEVPRPDKLILLVGNEARGLSDAALSMCDMTVRIPMAGRVESLNAAVAGGILLYYLNGSRIR